MPDTLYGNLLSMKHRRMKFHDALRANRWRTLFVASAARQCARYAACVSRDRIGCGMIPSPSSERVTLADALLRGEACGRWLLSFPEAIAVPSG